MDLKQELESIATIASEIEKIPEERRMAVVNFVLEKFNLKTTNTTSKITQSVQNSDNNDMSKMSIKEFVEQKQPKNNIQLIATLGYYLEKYENVEFGAKELTDANSKAKLSPISNTSRDLKNTQFLYRLVTSADTDKKKKKLTVTGEKVVEALPDQGKVKAVIKDIRKAVNKQYTKKKDPTKSNE